MTLLRVFSIGWILAILFLANASFARTVNIAILETFESEEVDLNFNRLFKTEILDLFKGKHQVKFTSYPVKRGLAPQDFHQLLERAYANSTVDVVLVLDIAANQILGLRSSFAKPTFLPIVFTGQLLGYPKKGQGSGQKNLNYLTREFDFQSELRALQKVAAFRRAVVIFDQSLQGSVGPLTKVFTDQARESNVELDILPYSGDHEDLMARLPEGTEAVLYGSFPTVEHERVLNLLQAVNAEKLLSFSLSGETYVRLGALATNNPETDHKKAARRTALNIEEALTGQPASSFPVFFETSDRLVINMSTAKQIGHSPDFDVLKSATLLNEDSFSGGRRYSLADVARKAVQANLSLVARKLETRSAGESVKEVRGALLPQLDASASHNLRKETDSTRAGIFAESSTDGSITLTQLLYSDSVWASYTIAKYNHLSQKALLREVELDIVQSAVTSYLNVLLAKTTLDQERYNLEINRKNYQLAKNRVRVGTTDASDLYRWRSELANAQRGILVANSNLQQERQNLNTLLNRPIAEDFDTTVETLDNPELLISDKEVTDLISNRRSLRTMTDLFVKQGFDRSPELKQIEMQIASAERELARDRRAYWLPDLSLTGSYSHNFDEDKVGTPTEENDWQVGVSLSLPLFEGGARPARTAQSRLAVAQLKAEYKDVKNSIEQSVRSAMEAAHASYQSIELAKTSEQASQKNFELISASYAQGKDSIVDLLNAQESLIEAREASMNSVHSFLIDLMSLQRAQGEFDFFREASERKKISDEMKKQFQQNQGVRSQ